MLQEHFPGQKSARKSLGLSELVESGLESKQYQKLLYSFKDIFYKELVCQEMDKENQTEHMFQHLLQKYFSKKEFSAIYFNVLGQVVQAVQEGIEDGTQDGLHTLLDSPAPGLPHKIDTVMRLIRLTYQTDYFHKLYSNLEKIVSEKQKSKAEQVQLLRTEEIRLKEMKREAEET